MITLVNDTQKVRRANEIGILDALRNSTAPLTVAELARTTKLSLATCANLITILLESEDVMEMDEKESRGGRPARRYRVNPHSTLTLAMVTKFLPDKETIAYWVVDAVGEVIENSLLEYREVNTVEFEALIERMVHKYPNLKGLALSIPGIVRDGNIALCDLPGLQHVPVKQIVETRWPLTAVIENDMNFAALGFFQTLSGNNATGMAYVVFPSNAPPGSGLIVNGSLVKGMSEFAGEVSFIPFGDSRDKQVTKLHDPEWMKTFIAKTVTGIAAVTNPDVVVLTGDGLVAGMVPEIRQRCLEYLPPEHMPHLAYEADYEADCLSGMIAATHDALQLKKLENQ
jgi:Transcriptional regulator/sugar kinase